MYIYHIYHVYISYISYIYIIYISYIYISYIYIYHIYHISPRFPIPAGRRLGIQWDTYIVDVQKIPPVSSARFDEFPNDKFFR